MNAVVRYRHEKDPGKIQRIGESVRLRAGGSGGASVFANALQPGLQAIHIDVNDRRSEKSEHLADNQAADDGDAQGTAEL